MPKLHVAIISGGISAEREVSLRSGAEIKRHLDPNKYEVTDYDPATDILRLVKDAMDGKIDIAFIILHGRGGEDGTIQGLLELLKIPYTGSGVFASSAAMDKTKSKQLYRQAGMAVAKDAIINKDNSVDEIEVAVAGLTYPLFIKPNKEGSSFGAGIARTKDQVVEAIKRALEFDDTVLAEEYIDGTEITGAVLGNKKAEALPLIEIVPAAHNEFFNYEAKYDGSTKEICPARVNEEIAKRARDIACKAHGLLGCRGFSRTDMIIPRDPERYGGKDTIIVIETNTLPGMTSESLFPKAAKEHGLDFPALLDVLIKLALED